MLGVEETEQLERIAAWRGRSFVWEAVDEIRRVRGRLGARPAMRELHPDDDDADPAPGPFELAEAADLALELRRRVRSLNPRERETLEGVLEGVFVRELAARFRVSERQVWIYKRKALASLRGAG